MKSVRLFFNLNLAFRSSFIEIKIAFGKCTEHGILVNPMW